MSMIVTLAFDGGCLNNPHGEASSAAIIQDLDGRTLRHVGAAIGIASNNVAEWTGFYLGLQAAQELGASGVRAFGDSKLVVEQFRGNYAIRQESLREIAMETSKIAQTFADGVEIEHVPRERNRAADAIATAVLKGTYVEDAVDPVAGDIELGFVLQVDVDPKRIRAALDRGLTLKQLKKHISDEVEGRLIRCGLVGEYSVRPARIRG